MNVGEFNILMNLSWEDFITKYQLPFNHKNFKHCHK